MSQIRLRIDMTHGTLSRTVRHIHLDRDSLTGTRRGRTGTMRHCGRKGISIIRIVSTRACQRASRIGCMRTGTTTRKRCSRLVGTLRDCSCHWGTMALYRGGHVGVGLGHVSCDTLFSKLNIFSFFLLTGCTRLSSEMSSTLCSMKVFLFFVLTFGLLKCSAVQLAA